MKKPNRFETSNNNNSRKNSSAHKHLVRLTPAASRLRSTATYFHPLTTHGFENAQLMVLSGAQDVSYSEPGVQGGRPRRSAPKAQINIKYMFYILSRKNRNMTVWPSGLRRWLQGQSVRAWVRTPQLLGFVEPMTASTMVTRCNVAGCCITRAKADSPCRSPGTTVTGWSEQAPGQSRLEQVSRNVVCTSCPLYC